jgi:hypothetical protein
VSAKTKAKQRAQQLLITRWRVLVLVVCVVALAGITAGGWWIATARSEFHLLQGRWQRPDGGYIVDIKGVDANGILDAAYFNPKPIHVAQARATQTNNSLRIFIELRDVNYPGSTYHLTYAPHNDRLEGIYFQAVLNQTFDVFFVRLKQ